MRSYLFLLVLALIFSACSASEEFTFSGDWQLELSGDYSDSFDFKITADNSFDFTEVISINAQNNDLGIVGKVEPDGLVNAKIYLNGDLIGQLNGKIATNTGEGDWSAMGYLGNWSLTRK